MDEACTPPRISVKNKEAKFSVKYLPIVPWLLLILRNNQRFRLPKKPPIYIKCIYTTKRNANSLPSTSIHFLLHPCRFNNKHPISTNPAISPSWNFHDYCKRLRINSSISSPPHNQRALVWPTCNTPHGWSRVGAFPSP